jgi:hypothetical protein
MVLMGLALVAGLGRAVWQWGDELFLSMKGLTAARGRNGTIGSGWSD